jgi:hypothetical protein
VDGLAARLRTSAEALGDAAGIEAAWLRGAADLVEQGEAERHSVRTDAVWLEELASEARARKAALLSAWVDAAEALRTAIHALESERGPLVESLFPGWRGPSLRRHADQALAAEAELQRRLSSGYVARRLAELATHAALGTALEALAGAGAMWAAERERPALAGADADALRSMLLALAGRTAHLLERVRWLVRAALADRPALIAGVFPGRTRPADAPGEPSAARGHAAAEAAAPANTVAATQTAPAPGPLPEAGAPSKRRSRAVRRRPETQPEATAPAPARAAAGSDEAVSARSPVPEAATRARKQASTRRASRPGREAAAPVTLSTAPPAGNPGRAAAKQTGRSGRSTRAPAPPAPGAAPSTRAAGRSTRAAASAAPGATSSSTTGPERDAAAGRSTRAAATAAPGATSSSAAGPERAAAAGTDSAPAPGKSRPSSGRGAGRKAPARRS